MSSHLEQMTLARRGESTAKTLFKPGIEEFKRQCVELHRLEGFDDLLSKPCFVKPSSISDTEAYEVLDGNFNVMLYVIVQRLRDEHGTPIFVSKEEKLAAVAYLKKALPTEGISGLFNAVSAAFGENPMAETHKEEDEATDDEAAARAEALSHLGSGEDTSLDEIESAAPDDASPRRAESHGDAGLTDKEREALGGTPTRAGRENLVDLETAHHTPSADQALGNSEAP